MKSRLRFGLVLRTRMARAGWIAVGLLLGCPAGGLAQCTGPTTLLTLDGPSTGSLFGTSVAGLGDLTGDGVPDVAVGAPGVGQVRILSGATGVDLSYSPLAGMIGLGGFGWAVAGVGDVSVPPDGVPDFIVGTLDASPGGLMGAGQAQVFSGATGALLFTFNGATADEHLGRSVASPGDMDGDGVPDFVVGATWPMVSTITLGRVRVYSGGSGSEFPYSPLSDPGFFGDSLAGTGDLNVPPDGVPDFIVSARGNPPSIPGSARVFSGATGTVLLTLGVGSCETRSVAGPGDVDSDGIPDLAALVSVPFIGCGPTWELLVFSGLNGNPLHSLPGGLSSVAQTLAAAGEVNGDGVPDLVLGFPTMNSLTGAAAVVSGASGSLLFPLFPPSFPTPFLAQFGTAVASAGDVDGDGKVDVLIGAPFSSTFGGSGRAFVFSSTGAASASNYGPVCAGSGGCPPLALTAGGNPCLGNGAFALTLSNVLGGAQAVLLIGFSPVNVPLPPVPGCTILASPDLLLGISTAGSGPCGGTVSLPMPIPPDSALAGALVFFQWYVADPGPGLVPGSMSRGLQILIG